jgi:signal transduction histidine kinase
MLRVLLDGYGGALSESVVAIIERAERRVIGLIDTVSDLLSVAEFDFQPEKGIRERVYIGPIIARHFDQQAEKATLKSVKLECEVPEDITIEAGADDIDKALGNLIENAIKYTPAGGSVNVTADRADDTIRIVVRDTGIGIPDEARERLFTEFFRAPNAKEFEPMGTGLGLVIVKRSTERWGGRIAVESDGRSGTAFTLTFPDPERHE